MLESSFATHTPISSRANLIRAYVIGLGATVGIALLAFYASSQERDHAKTSISYDFDLVSEQPRRVSISSNDESPSSATVAHYFSSPQISPVRLKGTRLGKNAIRGHADIGVGGASPLTYQVGALLANGSRLIEVYSDRVVLERNGERTTIFREVDLRNAADSADSSASLADDRISSRPSIKLSSDPLTEQIRLSPQYHGDTLQGIDVHPAPQSQGFRDIGLMRGDCIVEIDGGPVSTSSEAISKLRRLTDGHKLAVTVRRGGNMERLILDGSVLVSHRNVPSEVSR